MLRHGGILVGRAVYEWCSGSMLQARAAANLVVLRGPGKALGLRDS